jgi:hypothetical protein
MTLRRILSAVFVPLFLFMAVAFPMEKSYATESLNLLPSETTKWENSRLIMRMIRIAGHVPLIVLRMQKR